MYVDMNPPNNRRVDTLRYGDRVIIGGDLLVVAMIQRLPPVQEWWHADAGRTRHRILFTVGENTMRAEQYVAVLHGDNRVAVP